MFLFDFFLIDLFITIDLYFFVIILWVYKMMSLLEWNIGFME